MIVPGAALSDPPSSATAGALVVLSTWAAQAELSPAALIIVSSALIAAGTAMGLLDGIRSGTKRMSRGAQVWMVVAILASIWLCVTTLGAAGRAGHTPPGDCYAYDAGTSTIC